MNMMNNLSISSLHGKTVGVIYIFIHNSATDYIRALKVHCNHGMQQNFLGASSRKIVGNFKIDETILRTSKKE